MIARANIYMLYLVLTEFSIRRRSSSLFKRWSLVNASATPFLLRTTLQSPTFATCNSPSFNSTLAAQAPLLTPWFFGKIHIIK